MEVNLSLTLGYLEINLRWKFSP